MLAGSVSCGAVAQVPTQPVAPRAFRSSTAREQLAQTMNQSTVYVHARERCRLHKVAIDVRRDIYQLSVRNGAAGQPSRLNRLG